MVAGAGGAGDGNVCTEMEEMRIPNVDGNYQTRDGSVKVVVTRKDISIELRQRKEPKVHYIDDEPPRAGTGSVADSNPQFEKISKGVQQGIKFINDSLM